MLRKPPISSLKTSYPLAVETGMILALLCFITVTHIKLPQQNTHPAGYFISDETALILPPPITETPALKSPPAPIVPIHLPSDELLSGQPIDLPELNLTTRLMIPPLPNELQLKSNLDLFKDIEQPPEMLGGEQAFQNSIKYPARARNSGIEGIVEVEFTVDEFGKIRHPLIIRGIGGGCDQAVLTALKFQRYKPGKKGGKPASFRIKEQVQFLLINP